MIALRCYTCGLEFDVADDSVGQTAKCPRCLHVMPIAAESAQPAVAGSAGLPTTAPEEIPSGELPAAIPVNAPDADTIVPAGSAPGGGVGETLAGEAIPPGTPREAYDFLSAPQAPDELGRLGPYRVLSVLGAGGMGVVFRAEDPRLHRVVALKAMLPTLAVSATARQRFQREAEAAAKLDDDHIVHIYDVGEDRGIPFLAMQFLKGQPLEAFLLKQPRPPLPELLRIGREIAEGLAAAHAHGLVHRDIKPANIWLEAPPAHAGPDQRSRVKLLDFGLARAVSGDVSLTQSGAILGTPGYMAPEQSGKNADHRCDLFSLGCVLYRMATGQAPFRSADPVSTLIAVATEIPAAPRQRNPAIPPALDALIMQLLAKDPAQRPESAAAVVKAMQEIEKRGDAPDLSTSLKGIITQRIGAAMERVLRKHGQTVAPRTPVFQRPPTPRPSRPNTAVPEVIPVNPVRLRFPPRKQRRSKWLKLVIVIAIVYVGLKIAGLIFVSNVKNAVQVTMDESGDAEEVKLFENTIFLKKKDNIPSAAKRAAVAYLKTKYESKLKIESAELEDSQHAVFRGTGTDDGGSAKFWLRMKLDKKTHHWVYDDIKADRVKPQDDEDS
jgi:serine/threonine protein kinase